MTEIENKVEFFEKQVKFWGEINQSLIDWDSGQRCQWRVEKALAARDASILAFNFDELPYQDTVGRLVAVTAEKIVKKSVQRVQEFEGKPELRVGT